MVVKYYRTARYGDATSRVLRFAEVKEPLEASVSEIINGAMVSGNFFCKADEDCWIRCADAKEAEAVADKIAIGCARNEIVDLTSNSVYPYMED